MVGGAPAQTAASGPPAEASPRGGQGGDGEVAGLGDHHHLRQQAERPGIVGAEECKAQAQIADPEQSQQPDRVRRSR